MLHVSHRPLWVLVILVASSSHVLSHDDDQLVRYDNYSLFQIWSPSGETTIRLEDGYYECLILSRPETRSPSYQVLVPPHTRQAFVQALTLEHWQFVVLEENVQPLIDAEASDNEINARAAGAEYSWTQYHTYEETTEWMKSLPALYPDTVTAFSIGKTYLGQQIMIIFQ